MVKNLTNASTLRLNLTSFDVGGLADLANFQAIRAAAGQVSCRRLCCNQAVIMLLPPLL